MVSSLNAQSKAKLVPTVKMVKAYFRNKDLPLKSFHSEVLASNIVPGIIADWDAKGYRYGYQHILSEFLKLVSSIVTLAVQLPGSYSPPIDSGLSQSYLGKLSVWLMARGNEAWGYAQYKA